MTFTSFKPLSALCVASRWLGAPIGLCLLLAACTESTKPPAAPPPPEVTVMQPKQSVLQDEDDYVGRFVAVTSIEVRARVSGSLETVHFRDGSQVKQGDLLFSIDRRPFQNALDQARATLTQALANRDFAEQDFARAQQLVRDKTITEQALDQRLQSLRNARASVEAGQALVKQAELDLQFTELRAPVDGRIGDRRVSPGNLVTGGNSGNTSLLATIITQDPIHFEFTLDESAYLRYKRAFGTALDSTAAPDKALPVTLKLIDESGFDHKGHIDFIDNVIDRSTGTLRARAVFANRDGLFTPGMFARIKLPASQPYTALLVPDEAIASEQVRKLVMTVNADNVVVPKYVELGALKGGLRVIRKGLNAEDRVIVNGLMRARPGLNVTPRDAGAQTPKAQ
jgi:multidrug efflux system membrane fusion protein